MRLGFGLALLAFALSANARDKVFTEQAEDGTWTLYASNDTLGPETFHITFTLIDNIKVKEPEVTVVVPAKAGNMRVLKLEAADPTKKHEFKYDWTYAPGDHRTARHDPDVLYLFPFEHGKKYLVSQAALGARSHNVAGAKQAVDFGMKEGDTICAARKGLVVATKADSKLGGDDRAQFFRHSNFVKIQHEDGSAALYSHLQFDSLTVKPGDRVAAGDPIARCGNTGYSSNPHLDFKVTLPSAKGEVETVPLRFRDADGQAVTVKAGLFYYSHHPGGPDVAEIFGRDISNESHARHHAVVAPLGKLGRVRIRLERLDNTTVFFARNSDADDTYLVTLWLTEQANLDASKKLPVQVTVPPLSERFLFFVRVKDPLLDWRHRYQFTTDKLPENAPDLPDTGRGVLDEAAGK